METTEGSDDCCLQRMPTDRNPHIGCDPQFPAGSFAYQQEMMTVPKDAIYAAIHALGLAIGYMPQIKTDVPQW